MAYQETIHSKEGFDAFVSSAAFWTRLLKGSLPGGNAAIERAGFQGALNFDVTGKAGGAFQVVVEGGTVRLAAGSHAAPQGTVTLPDELFMRLLSGVASWATVHSSGQVQLTGDAQAAKAVGALFAQLKSARGGGGPTAWATRWWTNRVIRKSGVVREAH
ncbi:MAG: SCP2 sterol-binding domain-containing protein [bacterium]